ncbi:MAG TPA: phosphoglycerate dehydrogenase, partial [Desulfobacteraceae bacterium]|nr:phosphoglycerate dehydrogenase [Desulfobacteraceae bacterium]
MYRIMIRDNMSSRAKEIFEETGQIEVVVDNDKALNDPAVLADILGEFDGIAIRSGTKIKGPALEKSGKIKVIGRAGIGVDNIDVAEATSRGIVVMNTPEGNTTTTAEHAISMMLSLARQIPQANASIRSGKWEKKKFMGVEISGKTLGIIGLGHIGRIVAGRAQGLDMKVTACDPYVTREAAAELHVDLLPFEELLAQADFITLHVPRLEETRNLINRNTIALMKPGVRIINCARGEVVNLDDLYEGLKSGHVGGAALDVYPREPPDTTWPIFTLPNVIFTPHLGASTGEAQMKVAEMVAQQMVDYLLNGVITNAVNFPSIPVEMMSGMKPYLDLAERMGSMMGQIVRTPEDITVTYSGEVTKFDTRVLTHAVLKGLLGAFTDTPVNYVSAPARARAKGLHVEETISLQMKDYTNLIRVKFPGLDDELNEIWGTVFAKNSLRIVRLGNVYMDAIPEGYMLVIRNDDRPGVIGSLGTALAAGGIN